LPYLRAAIFETLRLQCCTAPCWGAWWHFSHLCPARHLCDVGHLRGESAAVIYGDDLADFRPERWLAEEGPARWLSREAFIPFGSGPRNCLGQQFAMLQTSYIAARLLAAFEHFQLRDGDVPFQEAAAAVTHWNGRGIWVKFQWETKSENIKCGTKIKSRRVPTEADFEFYSTWEVDFYPLRAIATPSPPFNSLLLYFRNRDREDEHQLTRMTIPCRRLLLDWIIGWRPVADQPIIVPRYSSRRSFRTEHACEFVLGFADFPCSVEISVSGFGPGRRLGETSVGSRHPNMAPYHHEYCIFCIILISILITQLTCAVATHWYVSVMAVCTYCARLINENCFDSNDQKTVQHHPNIYSFEESAQSCELCRYFVQLCGPGRIQRVKKDADVGLWNRTRLNASSGSSKPYFRLSGDFFCLREVNWIILQGFSIVYETLEDSLEYCLSTL
jgi:hypothetical protein